jgi:hypothetical protein
MDAVSDPDIEKCGRKIFRVRTDTHYGSIQLSVSRPGNGAPISIYANVKVPTEQISLVLGHLPKGSDATTSIYAPYDPDYCVDAAAAIESVMQEVRGHLTRAKLDPAESAADGLILTGKASRRGLGEAKRAEIRTLILAGVRHKEVMARTGISGGTISLIRQELKKTVALYRATSRCDLTLSSGYPG